MSEQGIGWIYAVTSFVTIVLMLMMPRLIRRFGNLKVLNWLTILSILAVIPLVPALLPWPQKVIHTLTAFFIYIVLGYLIRYVLDVYLENVSDDETTGSIRGLYMTFYNFAWLVSPFLAAYLVSQGDYGLVYGLTGILLIPLLLISLFGLKEN